MDQSQSRIIFILFCDWQFAESEKVAKYILRWYTYCGSRTGFHRNPNDWLEIQVDCDQNPQVYFQGVCRSWLNTLTILKLTNQWHHLYMEIWCCFWRAQTNVRKQSINKSTVVHVDYSGWKSREIKINFWTWFQIIIAKYF